MPTDHANRATRSMARLLAIVALAAGLAAGCGRDAGGPASDAALRARVDSLLPAIATASGLDAREPVRVARQEPNVVRAYVEDQLAEEFDQHALGSMEIAYNEFGLIPDTVDLRALLLDLYSEQVVGYYDPATDTLYVVGGVPDDALEPVLVHELVHALQDQHVDLDSLVAPARGNDPQTAAQAAIEGHATLVMFAVMAERQAGASIDVTALPDLGEQLRPSLEAQNEQFPVFRTAPVVIRETLLFAYLQGASFVQSLWAAAATEGSAGRPAPFDSLLPLSTEQVIHAERRFLEDRDSPTAIRLGDLGSAAAADGWTSVYRNGLGELETSILLREHLGAEAGAAAEGWDGDRYVLLQHEDGARALAWISVWDDAASADDFADAYRRALEARAGRHGRVERLDIDDRALVRVIDTARSVPLDAVPVPAVVGLHGLDG